VSLEGIRQVGQSEGNMQPLELKGESGWYRKLYEITINDINASKQRQWAVANSVLLVFAALAAAHQRMQLGDLGIGLVLVGAGLIAAYGILYVLDNQGKQVAYRETILDIRAIRPEIRNVVLLEDEKIYTSYDRDAGKIVVPRVCVQVGGFIVLGNIVTSCRAWAVWFLAISTILLVAFTWWTYFDLRDKSGQERSRRQQRRATSIRQ
jgi:hypothetical protein